MDLELKLEPVSFKHLRGRAMIHWMDEKELFFSPFFKITEHIMEQHEITLKKNLSNLTCELRDQVTSSPFWELLGLIFLGTLEQVNLP